MIRTIGTVFALACAAAAPLSAQEQAKDPELLYSDESWTHVGDDNFSPESDSASDLTKKSAGNELEIEFVLDDAARTLLADPKYVSVVFLGTAIGNDTGRLGDCTASIVDLNGKKVGEIAESGSFKIAFDKALLRLDATAEEPNVLKITTGANGAQDRDDQEMGQFAIRASTDPVPEPSVEKETDDR